MRVLTLLLISTLLVSPSWAIGNPLKKVAKDMGKKIRKLNSPKVAILAFPYHDGRVSSGSSIVGERLTTHFVNMKGIRVVERRLISKIMEEQHMSETGVIDPETAQQLGKVLGIDVIITGTLIEVSEDKTEVNARGLKADTGEVITASHAVIQKTWNDRPRFKRRAPARDPEMEQDDPEQVQEQDEENEAIRVGIPALRPARRGYRRRWR